MFCTLGTFLSLQVAYTRRDTVHKFVRKVLALPYLPGEHIPGAFRTLQEAAATRLLDGVRGRDVDAQLSVASPHIYMVYFHVCHQNQ